MLLLVIYKFQKEKKKGVCVGGGKCAVLLNLCHSPIELDD